MYRLVIADDEKTIRESIATLIDWDKLDVKVVAVCKNGNEAYDAILDEYPDIVLTDIRMPGMSGLEMIQRHRETGSSIEYIILSGYGEFEYAKKAMELGVQNFLVKPCNENEIIEVIQKVKALIDRKRRFIELSAQQYAVKNDVFSSRIWTILEEELTNGSEKEPFALFSEYLLEKQTPCLLCKYTLQAGDDPLLFYNDLNRDCRSRFPESSLCQLEAQQHLYLLVEGVENEEKGFFAQRPGASSAEIWVFSGLKEGLQHILSFVNQNGKFSIRVHGANLPLKGGTATPQAEKIIDGMKNSVSGAATSNKVVDRTIQYMREHLADPDISLKNIAETYLYMNVDYVSKQFVKFTGKRFSTYLNQLKIDKAKQILSDHPDIKISRVAEEVGCANNPQYFNYIFKKITGMTPSSFQQSLQ